MTVLAATEDRLSRHPAFLAFWLSRVLTSLGFQMASVVIGWMVYEKTGSAYDLGLVGLFQFLPMVLLTFVVGTVADRVDRRRIVIVCQAVEGLTLAGLALGAITDTLSVTAIFVAVAVLGGARAFEHPTLSALLPGLVPENILHKAIAMSSSAMQTATIIGPSLGGLLYALGAPVPLGLAAVFFLAAATAMALVQLERPAPQREPVTLASVFSGIGFVWSRPLLLGVLSLDMFAVLLGGVTALLPIFAADVLNAGPWALGLLRSAPAVGAIAMAFALSRFPLNHRVGLKMFAAVIVFGLATIAFSASGHLWLSLIALVVLGAADNVSVVIRHSLVQLATPDEMRGRVNALNSLFIGTSNQLGEFESGMTAGLFGAVAAGILGGVGTVAVALLWMRIFPALREADTLAGERRKLGSQ
ncbi:MFS transporter [Azorhizobium oxalatiphilum]|uniref:MFS transporter n=1 Tax=Azorhizobium oxalatiphilum TaxID=980631 RepID=A0A917CFC6_9HYPH|nr:MFS transporter [Azorhizobium oxalatiphilum]GGF86131.1 MFS transporter [Azorhizobium oxalatiphilum]